MAILSVAATNDCGAGPSSPTLSISINALPNPVISGLNVVCQNWNADYVTDVNTGSTYLWTVTGGSVVSGAGTASVTINWNTAGTGTLQVDETSFLNCSGTSLIYNVAVDACVNIEKFAQNQEINIYPNPNNGSFWLSNNTPGNTVYKMEILNSFGVVVFKTDKLEVNATFKQYFDLHELSAGMYTLVLRSDAQQISKKIVINK